MGSANPLEKMDEKLKSENMQKEHFSERKDAPFCSQIFKKFFISRGKGGLTPLTKILRTPLSCCYRPTSCSGGGAAADV